MSRRNSTELDEQSSEMLQRPENMSFNVRDRFYSTYILFYALGTLTNVPQNFFITANDYWMYKFRDPDLPYNNSNEANRTGLQAEFTSSFSITSSVTSIACLVLAIVLAKWVSIQKRIIGALLAMLCLFILTIVFIQVNTDSWQTGFFVISLAIGSLLNGVGAIFMVSLFQLSSKFPYRYLAAQLSGQAICGIFASLVQISSLAIGASSTINAFIYFTIGACCILGTLIFYFSMWNKSVFFRYHATKENPTSSEKPTLQAVLVVLGKIKYLLMTMIIVLGCTIMVNPGVTALVKSVGTGTKWNDVFFVPVITFFCFHLFDFIGRELAGVFIKPKNSVVMLIISILRIGFVPLLMFCNAQPRKHLAVLFESDTAYIILLILFAFSSGYLTNLCVIRIPTVTEPEESKIAMPVIVVFMVVSLGTCSFLSILLVKSL